MQRYTTEEIAEHFKVSIKTINRWRNEQQIPSMTIGGVIRFDLMAVEEAIDKRHTLKSKY